MNVRVYVIYTYLARTCFPLAPVAIRINRMRIREIPDVRNKQMECLKQRQSCVCYLFVIMRTMCVVWIFVCNMRTNCMCRFTS